MSGSTLPIHEIFRTFQGEGVHMGRPAFFIRTYGCPLKCGFCFGEGVKLHTTRGRVDIKDIKVGDLVWSFNEKTQQQEFTKVLGAETRIASSHYDVWWRDGGSRTHSIKAKVTGDHPFWVVGRGWVEVKDLVPRTPPGQWKGNGRHQGRDFSDVVMEIDAKAYINSFRRERILAGEGLGSDKERRRSRVRMRIENPVHMKGVADRARDTLRRKIRAGEAPNVLQEMWKRESFRKNVTRRMIERNPNRDPISHAKSCYRPMGMVSSVEQFVVDVVRSNSLPFVHNRGKVLIGGRVPDFVYQEKKKLVEVTSPDFQDREKNGYHEKNRIHYKKYGYDCLTLYIPKKSIEMERTALERLTEFAHNGREIIRSESVNLPLKVYSIRTENHTFFVDGVLTHNCDAAGTWSYDYIPKNIAKMEVTELAAEATVRPLVDFVVITGGEPTIHDLGPLCLALHQTVDLGVHLETSGAYPIKGQFDWITLSPKKWKMPLVENTHQADEFKIIVEQPEDIDFYLQFLMKCFHPSIIPIPVWLHPEWSHRHDPVVLSAISKAVVDRTYDADVRAGWQIHKNFLVDLADKRSRPPVPLGGNPEKGF